MLTADFGRMPGVNNVADNPVDIYHTVLDNERLHGT